ncbi:hypothetical protein KM043_009348 [Ampulex compressa]|nr:hypothetical protein KM043_009348 [Ampulex compressa]
MVKPDAMAKFKMAAGWTERKMEGLHRSDVWNTAERSDTYYHRSGQTTRAINEDNNGINNNSYSGGVTIGLIIMSWKLGRPFVPSKRCTRRQEQTEVGRVD